MWRRLPAVVFGLLVLLTGNAWAETYLLIPMDLDQRNHLRAYGVAFHTLQADEKVNWLLNYRGGAFLIEQNPRVELDARLLGVDYEIEAVGPRTPEILALNPSGKLPVLKDGDDAIIDSTAIIQYLADKHGKFTYAAGSIERAKQDSFTCFALDDLDGILWTTAKHSFIFPEEMRAAGVKAAARYDFAKSLTALEKRLGDNEYVMEIGRASCRERV